MAASAEVTARLEPIMRRMFAEPDGSTISDMLQAAEGTFDERFAWIVPSIKIIITGGMQEPGHSAGSTVLGLLTNPDQAAEMAADPAGLVRPAVEEGLRWISPIGTQTRRATRDTVLAGIEVPAGANIGLLVSSANRDRAVWGADADLTTSTGPSVRMRPSGLGRTSVPGITSPGCRSGSGSRRCSSAAPISDSTPSGRPGCAAGSFVPPPTCTLCGTDERAGVARRRR